VDPDDQFSSPFLVLATPVVLELYGSASSSGEPYGDVLGTVKVTFKDREAQVTYSAAPGFVLSESNLYLGDTRIPSADTGNGTNPDLDDFPYRVTNETKTQNFIFDLATYDFYIAAHGRICGNFPTGAPISSTPSTIAPSEISRAPTNTPSPSASQAPTVLTSQPTICRDWQTITFEDYENYDWSWKGGNVTTHREFSTYLGKLGEHMSTVSKQFRVPPAADHLSIEFDFYEIDFWCSCDHITVEICDTQVDLGKFTPGDRGYVEGEVDGITWSSNSLTGSNMMGFNGFNDQKHKLKMTIPRRCYVSGFLDIAFNLTTSDMASGGVDNLNITAYGLCGTDFDFPDIGTLVPMQSMQPSESPSLFPSEVPSFNQGDSGCTEARMVVFEDFEGYYDSSWVGGEINDDYQLQFSHFLGRFGREQNRAAKTYDVPKDAKSLTVEFLFYEIDSWEHRDRLLFIVGNTRLDLKQFGIKNPSEPKNLYSLSGKASGIYWQRTTETESTNLGFSSFAKDQKHRVSISIPSRYYAETGKLKLGFYVETSHDVWSESGGIDNIKITAHGINCQSDGSPRSPSSADGEVCAHFWGDPHVVTFDGLKYDCQGEGEFVLLSSLDSSFSVQGRFVGAAAGKKASVTRGYVVQTGDEGVPKIQLSVPDEMTNGCPIELMVDGVPHDIYNDGTGSDFVQVQVVGQKGTQRVTIYYPSTGLHFTSLLSESETFGCYLSSSICLPDDYRPGESFVGLLGSPNGNRKDDWMTPQGSPVSILGDKRFEAAYQYCTENWCVRNKTDSLFSHASDQTFNDAFNCDAPYNPAIEDAIANAADELIEMCNG
jgi:von Willebrand factor type D domain